MQLTLAVDSNGSIDSANAEGAINRAVDGVVVDGVVVDAPKPSEPSECRELLPRTLIVEVCGWRSKLLAMTRDAIAKTCEGHRVMHEVNELEIHATGGHEFYIVDRSKQEHYKNLQYRMDPEKSYETYRQYLDAKIWKRLIAETGMENMMDRTAKEKLDKDLEGTVPEATEENIRSTFASLFEDAELIFQRGLARAFIDLDRRFKSHDGFKIGSRIILTYVFDKWGSWNYSSRMSATMADVQRVFAVLDGKKQTDNSRLEMAIRDSRRGGMNPHQSETETEYFRVRGYQNGNAHLWFKRDDLVQKANEVLAAYYGAVLPDGVPADVNVRDLKSTALCKNLSFYATPAEAAARVLREVYVKDKIVLEPSAGVGGLVIPILEEGAARVDAVEVYPDRVEALNRIRHPRLRVISANFLMLEPRAEYDVVVMNPLFHGTHWMDHVTHAFKFLKSQGTLITVLPITAELGESKRHEAFRAWAKQHAANSYGRMFQDLPPESFASVGTRINTVFLELRAA